MSNFDQNQSIKSNYNNYSNYNIYNNYKLQPNPHQLPCTLTGVRIQNWSKQECRKHCVKSVQIQSFFWSIFSCIRTEYGDILRTEYKEILRISPYSVRSIPPYSLRIQGNTDQKKLSIWTLFTQWRSSYYNVTQVVESCIIVASCEILLVFSYFQKSLSIEKVSILTCRLGTSL